MTRGCLARRAGSVLAALVAAGMALGWRLEDRRLA